MSIDEVMSAAFRLATTSAVFTTVSGEFDSDGESAVQERAMQLRAAIEQHVAEAVAREREACAKACEDVATTQWDEYAASYNSAVFDCAAAIRARAEKETK